jgi:cyclic pyranopterin phosphate synthase
MVDVSDKDVGAREATAEVIVSLGPQAYVPLRDGRLPKGDAIAMAQAAGIMAAKQTPYLLPLCHPLPLEQVTVAFRLDDVRQTVIVSTVVKTTARTGPEMEALTAASVAALTIYDMCKGLNPAIRIDGLRLLQKSGGKSGSVILDAATS